MEVVVPLIFIGVVNFFISVNLISDFIDRKPVKQNKFSSKRLGKPLTLTSVIINAVITIAALGVNILVIVQSEGNFKPTSLFWFIPYVLFTVYLLTYFVLGLIALKKSRKQSRDIPNELGMSFFGSSVISTACVTYAGIVFTLLHLYAKAMAAF